MSTANLISTSKSAINHRAASKYQFEIQFKEFPSSNYWWSFTVILLSNYISLYRFDFPCTIFLTFSGTLALINDKLGLIYSDEWICFIRFLKLFFDMVQASLTSSPTVGMLSILLWKGCPIGFFVKVPRYSIENNVFNGGVPCLRLNTS